MIQGQHKGNLIVILIVMHNLNITYRNLNITYRNLLLLNMMDIKYYSNKQF